MQIFPIVFALAATGIWIAVERATRRQMRTRLGTDVHEIRLYRRWAQWAQRLFLGLALLMPLVTVIMWSRIGSLEDADLFTELIRSLWLLSVAFGLSQSGRLLIGSEGIHLGRGEPLAWHEIESIAWDRDIGQLQWGSTIVVDEATAKKKSMLRKHRLYVNRALKPEVESHLRKHTQVEDAIPAQPPRKSPQSTHHDMRYPAPKEGSPRG